MPESLQWHLTFFVVLLYGLNNVSRTNSNSKDVCQGDYVQLFYNITFTNGNTVNVWINGMMMTLIGTWDSFKNPKILERYKEKLFLDEYGTIWLRNIEHADNGTYLLQYNTDGKLPMRINVMVAPTKQCKPKIQRIDNLLITSWNEDFCGRPLPVAHWMNHPDIHVISKSVARLTSDSEPGSYSVCAETPALQCVKKLQMSDYCTTFTTEGLSSTEPNSIAVCKGDYVPIFHNITFTNGNIVKVLINSLQMTQIGTWNSFQDAVIQTQYKEKVSLDEYGTIFIRNIQLSDDGTYFLQLNADVKSVMKINVMAAPTKQCKPEIKNVGELLMTSLEAKVCGKPVAFARWMNHPYISNISNTVIILSADNDGGSYYICAETPALQCVKNLKMSDYCTTFITEGRVPGKGTEYQSGKDKDNSLLASPEILQMKIVNIVTLTFVSVIVFAVGLYAVVSLIRKRQRKMSRRLTKESLELTPASSKVQPGRQSESNEYQCILDT